MLSNNWTKQCERSNFLKSACTVTVPGYTPKCTYHQHCCESPLQPRVVRMFLLCQWMDLSPVYKATVSTCGQFPRFLPPKADLDWLFLPHSCCHNQWIRTDPSHLMKKGWEHPSNQYHFFGLCCICVVNFLPCGNWTLLEIKHYIY